MNKAVDYDGIFPDVLVTICGGKYSLSSRHVVSIMPLPNYKEMPCAPKHMLGVINFREEAVPVLDMRSIFHLMTRKEEYEAFTQMLNLRREDHIHWVKELENSMLSNKPFSLATDPHKCAFGQWYYSFKSDSQIINYHMNKIEEPHRKLHEAALEMGRCRNNDKQELKEACCKNVLNEVEGKYMPVILRLLEEAKEIFKSAYAEMVLILDNGIRKVGIVVDEVLSVELLGESQQHMMCRQSEYIAGVKEKRETGEMIFELDDEKLLDDEDALSTAMLT